MHDLQAEGHNRQLPYALQHNEDTMLESLAVHSLRFRTEGKLFEFRECYQ